MKFRRFIDNTPTEIYIAAEGRSHKCTLKNSFELTGFTHAEPPYTIKRWSWIQTVLQESGFSLQFSTVYRLENSDQPFTAQQIQVPKHLKGGYFLLKDEDIVNGKAVLMSIAPGNNNIIMQGHREHVLDKLLSGDLFRELGIDYRVEEVDEIEATYKELNSGRYKI